METAKFNKNGGPIFVEIKAGFAQPGSYTIFLWETGTNQVIKKYEGNFIHADDDKFQLPLPVVDNDGRIIDAGVTFKIVPPIKDYFVEVIVTQDGHRIGGDEQRGTTDEQTKSLKLLIQLSQEDSRIEQDVVLEDDYTKYKDDENIKSVETKQEDESVGLLLGKRRGFSINEDIDGVIGVKELAGEIATLLQNLKTDEKGKMIGVFGKWGRGKTFLMEQIWERLNERKENKFHKVEFHAWKYQDTPASWAYLYESFAKLYYSAKEIRPFRRPFYQFARIWRLNFKRYGFLPLWGLVTPIILYLLGISDVFKFNEEFLNEFNEVLLGMSGLSIAAIYKFYIKFNSKATDLFKKYIGKQPFKELLGVQAEIQKELRNLLISWIPKREFNKKGSAVLLVVDDIDRCQETRLIQIIDSLRIMLEDDEISKRVVVLAAIDGNVLKRAIKWKYYDLIETDYELEKKIEEKIEVSKNLINEYMDKLFLSGIKLGVLTSEERLDIFNAFSKGKIAPDKNDDSDNKKYLDEKNQKQGKLPRDEEKDDNIITFSTYDLEQSEATELISLIKRFDNATPRQIRIFYYRYLLARNLLDRQIQKMQLKSIGTNENGNSIMGELLLHYSLSSDLIELKNMKKKIAYDNTSDQCTIKFYGEEYTDSRELLYQICNVLEMVIAY